MFENKRREERKGFRILGLIKDTGFMWSEQCGELCAGQRLRHREEREPQQSAHRRVSVDKPVNGVDPRFAMVPDIYA